MPVSIQASVKVGIALNGVAPSRDDGLAPFRLNLLAYPLTVVAFVRDDRFSMRQLGYQLRGSSAVIDLTAGDHKLDG